MSKIPIDENRVLKEGFLTKKGSNLVKQWKERWFVIRGQTLYYYRNPRDKKPVGSISLKDVTEVVVDNKEHMANCFRLVSKKKTYLVSAQTPDDRDTWIKSLDVARTGYEITISPRQTASMTQVQVPHPLIAQPSQSLPSSSIATMASMVMPSSAPLTRAQSVEENLPKQQTRPSDPALNKLQSGDVRGRSSSASTGTAPVRIRGKSVSESASELRVVESNNQLNPPPPPGPASPSPKLRNQSRPKAATAPRQRFISEPRQIVTTKYDYTAGTERELSFKAGDKVVVLKKYESGWWLGELDGKIGHFPASYAEVDPASSDLDSPSNGKEPEKQTKVRALYDYNGQSFGELSFKKDDEFILLEKLSDGGWWKGQIGDKKGHFPASFVQIIESKIFDSSSSDVDSDKEEFKVMSLGRAQGKMQKPDTSSPNSPTSPPSPDEKSGSHIKREAQVLGQYQQKLTNTKQLGEMLGKGAFGVVYRGLNIETGAFVAIKQIPARGVPHGHLESIMTELQLLKELSHPNIVQYIALIETKDHINFVLEYIEGGSLEALLKKFGKMPETLINRYTQQILQGLNYLHSRNVIHRDIKCGNILITKDGTVKLADFGIATNLSTESGPDAAGSPYWMAPEIIELKGACPASDIWSLACAIIELLTGDPPYVEMAPMQALFAMVEQPHPPLPPCSPALQDFLLKCFIRDVKERWSAARLLTHYFISPNCPTTSLSQSQSSNTPEVSDADSETSNSEEEEDDNEEALRYLKQIKESTSWLEQELSSARPKNTSKLRSHLEEQVKFFKANYQHLPDSEGVLKAASDAIAKSLASSALSPTSRRKSSRSATNQELEALQLSVESISLDKLG